MGVGRQLVAVGWQPLAVYVDWIAVGELRHSHGFSHAGLASHGVSHVLRWVSWAKGGRVY